MTREALFAAVRPFAPGQKFSQEQVGMIDALADRFGLPRSGAVRSTSQRGIDLIHSFESLRLDAYPDPGPTGLPVTIGWGSTRDESGQKIRLGDRWTKQRADARFAADLSSFEKAVSDAVGNSPTTQGQFDALVSFAYNLGAANLSGSTLLKKHREGDYAGARAEFARWNRAGGKVLAGLTRRRQAEADLYAS